MTRRLGIALKLDPYDIWDRRSLRQVLELGQSYEAMNKSASGDKPVEGEAVIGKGKHKGAKVPSWYTAPKGAKILDIETIQQGDL